MDTRNMFLQSYLFSSTTKIFPFFILLTFASCVAMVTRRTTRIMHEYGGSSHTHDCLPIIGMLNPTSCATMWGIEIILWYQLCDLPRNDGNEVRFWFSWNPWLSLPQYHSHAFYRVWWRMFLKLNIPPSHSFFLRWYW